MEKLRHELTEQQYLWQRISELECEIRDLRSHQHGAAGQVLVPANRVHAPTAGQAGRHNPLA